MRSSRSVRPELLAAVVATIAFAAPATVRPQSASMFSIKFTSQALGLGTTDLNGGKTVDDDRPGLTTGPSPGQGSVLLVGADGRATTSAPLVTVTATTHLDVLSFPPPPFPAVNDYQAGLIYVTKENTRLPDGKDEGLGVRVFTVVEGATATSGLRKLDGATGRALIEGSKEVSGGTDQPAYDAASPNGPPHVDEELQLAFADGSGVSASSLQLTLSRFLPGDVFVLTVRLAGGAVGTYSIGTDHPGMTLLGASAKDGVWRFAFASLGFAATDVVERIAVKAIDPDPSAPRGTAEHFDLAALGGTFCGADCNPPDRTLTVIVDGGCGMVVSDVGGLECHGYDGACQLTVPSGTVVTLATSVIGPGDVFDHWEGDNPCAGTSSASCTITMDADRDATAFFGCSGT